MMLHFTSLNFPFWPYDVHGWCWHPEQMSSSFYCTKIYYTLKCLLYREKRAHFHTVKKWEEKKIKSHTGICRHSKSKDGTILTQVRPIMRNPGLRFESQ